MAPGICLHISKMICIAWGWTWKCETHKTRIKCLRKNPKHLTLTHTHYTHTTTISVQEFGAFDIEKYHLCLKSRLFCFITGFMYLIASVVLKLYKWLETWVWCIRAQWNEVCLSGTLVSSFKILFNSFPYYAWSNNFNTGFCDSLEFLLCLHSPLIFGTVSPFSFWGVCWCWYILNMKVEVELWWLPHTHSDMLQVDPLLIWNHCNIST